MTDHRTISKRRVAFYDWVRAVPSPARQLAILAARGATSAYPIPSSFADDPLIQAFAALALVQFKYYARYEQGQRYLAFGLKGIGAALGDDARGARVRRDCHNIAGNFYARHFKTLRAVRCYTAALAGERDAGRRALVTVNLVKLLLADGRASDALEALDRVDLTRLGPESAAAREALRLARVRLLVLLGSAPAATEVVRETRGKSVEHRTNELERRYLGIMMRLDDQARVADFLAWVRREHEEGVAAFYELEMLVIKRARTGGKAPRAELLLAKNLSVKSGAIDTYALYEALRRALRRAAPAQSYADLAETLRGFGARDGQLLFQVVCSAVALRLTNVRDAARAQVFWRMFDEHAARLRIGLPKRLLLRLDERPSPLMVQRAALPPVITDRIIRALFP